jgi:branched-subunit amino acid transport protein
VLRCGRPHRPPSTIPGGALAQDQPGHFAPLSLGERRPEFLDRALSFAVPALLAALVAGTVVERHDIVIDARLAGVAAAAIVALLRGPLLASVAVAAVVTAALRALSGSVTVCRSSRPLPADRASA